MYKERQMRQKIILPRELWQTQGILDMIKVAYRNIGVNPANGLGIAFAFGHTIYVEPVNAHWEVYAYRRQGDEYKPLTLVPVHNRNSYHIQGD